MSIIFYKTSLDVYINYNSNNNKTIANLYNFAINNTVVLYTKHGFESCIARLKGKKPPETLAFLRSSN